jgi:hypothetical protein
MKKQLICSACGQVGDGKTKIKGNGLIELILWLCFIIPGIIYSIWRSSSRYKACPSCGSTNLIPADSPIGKKLLADQGTTLEQVFAEQKSNSKGNVGKYVVFVLIAIILLTGFASLL